MEERSMKRQKLYPTFVCARMPDHEQGRLLILLAVVALP